MSVVTTVVIPVGNVHYTRCVFGDAHFFHASWVFGNANVTIRNSPATVGWKLVLDVPLLSCTMPITENALLWRQQHFLTMAATATSSADAYC